MAASLGDIEKKLKELQALKKELQKKHPDDPAFIEQNKALKEQLKGLQKKLDLITTIGDVQAKQKIRLQDEIKQLQAINKHLGAALTLNKHISTTFANHGRDLAKYLGSLGQWFKKGQDIAQEYFTITRNVGMSQKATAWMAA